jgi:DNA polymerase (family 10)
MLMRNRELAEIFETIANLLEIKGEGIYRVLAYRRAGEGLRSLGSDISEIWREGNLEEIPGVGKAIATKIDELLRTGELAYYSRLIEEVPEGLVEMLKISDVGPKKVARFWKELGITSLEALEAAAHAGRLRTLRGMGERSEARILESIESYKRRQTDRILVGQAWPIAEALVEQLHEVEGLEDVAVAGSLRRGKETIGDIDLLASGADLSAIIDAFLDFPQVGRVRSRGETKVSVELHDGLGVQLWVHPPERFGSALQYATGSQAHNVRLRELARKEGLSLSEHGFKREGGSEILCAQEAEVYTTLGLPWIPPELREDRGEVQAGLEGRLPQLVTLGDLRGELHAHTDWSDGAATLDEMVEAARNVGLAYLVISDHSQSLGVAQGLSIERLWEQRSLIEQLREMLGDGMRLLHGTEVEILADGRLDYPDEVLAELDIVIASLHSSLRQSGAQITERLLKAIANPHVDIIGHPSGRLIGKRDPADLDMDAITRAAADVGVALEINAHPDRLDLNDVHARMAVENGCLLAINSDAHHPDHFALRRYGVAIARRGWVEAESVLNTWPYKRLQAWLAARG